MLTIWHKVRCLEGYKSHFSLLTPIHQNPDFIPGLNVGFVEWFRRGIKTVGDLVDGDQVLSFQQVREKYGIGSGDILRYMQVKHFILGRLKECDGKLAVSPMESLILKTTKLKSFSKSVYSVLSELNTDNADSVKMQWETDRGPITAESWSELCNRPFKALTSNSI